MIHYTFLSFTITSVIVLFICWLVYRLVFHQVILKPSMNRALLLSLYVLAIVIPTLPLIRTGVHHISTEAIATAGNIATATATITASASPWLTKLIRCLNYIYVTGCAVIACLVLTNIARLILFTIKSYSTIVNGYRVRIYNNRSQAIFSWLGNIYIPADRIRDTDIEHLSMMILHENAHVAHRHWVDLSIAQVFIVLQWFNPIAWLLRKELQKVHEYQADSDVISSGADEVDYQTMLLANLCHSRVNGLTNSLNNSSLKQRIVMMRESYSQRGVGLRIVGMVSAAVLVAILLKTPMFAATVNLLDLLEPSVKTTNEKLIIFDKDGNQSRYSYDEVEIYVNDVKADNIDDINPHQIEGIAIDSLGSIRIKLKTDPDSDEKNSVVSVKSDPKNTAAPTDFEVSRANYYINGEEVEEATFRNLNPNTIQSIDVIKNQEIHQVRAILKETTGQEIAVTPDLTDNDEIKVTGHGTMKKRAQ